MNDLNMQNFDIQNVKTEISLRPIVRLGKTTPLPEPIAIFGSDPLHEALEINRNLQKKSLRVWNGFWVCKIITAKIDGVLVKSVQPEILQGPSYFGAVKILDTFQRQIYAAQGITHGVKADSGAWLPLKPGNRVYNLKSGELLFTAKA